MELSELRWLKDARAMLRGAAMEVYPRLRCTCSPSVQGAAVILPQSCPKCRLKAAIHYADPETYKTAARLTEALAAAAEQPQDSPTKIEIEDLQDE